MDALRWILLGVGAIFVALVYWWSRRSEAEPPPTRREPKVRAGSAEAPPAAEPEPEPPGRARPAEAGDRVGAVRGELQALGDLPGEGRAHLGILQRPLGHPNLGLGGLHARASQVQLRARLVEGLLAGDGLGVQRAHSLEVARALGQAPDPDLGAGAQEALQHVVGGDSVAAIGRVRDPRADEQDLHRGSDLGVRTGVLKPCRGKSR